MTIEKRKIRGEKNVGLSLRVTEEGFRRLKVLSALFNQSQANLMEDLVDGLYEKELKANPKQVKQVEVTERLKPK